METKIIEILKEVLETENVNAESAQENCENWDSLRHLNLIVELESAFDVSFEPEEIAEMTSVTKIKEFIQAKQ